MYTRSVNNKKLHFWWVLKALKKNMEANKIKTLNLNWAPFKIKVNMALNGCQPELLKYTSNLAPRLIGGNSFDRKEVRAARTLASNCFEC